jgi:hypothetical protein
MKEFIVKPEISVKVTQQDIDDIMGTALDCGISYWCYRAEVIGEYRGEYASDQISRGGMLRLWDSESDEKYILTLDGFLNGLKLWMENEKDEYGIIQNGALDTCNVDACIADAIVQYAIFKDVIYG